MKSTVKLSDGTLMFWSLRDGRLFTGSFTDGAPADENAKPEQISTFLRYINSHAMKVEDFRIIDSDTLTAVEVAIDLPWRQDEEKRFLRALRSSGKSAQDELSQYFDGQERLLAMRKGDSSQTMARFLELAYRQDGRAIEYYAVYLKDLPSGMEEEDFVKLSPRARQWMLAALEKGPLTLDSCLFLLRFLQENEAYALFPPEKFQMASLYAEAVRDEDLARILEDSSVGKTEFKFLPFQTNALFMAVLLACARDLGASALAEFVTEAYEADIYLADHVAQFYLLTLAHPTTPASWRATLVQRG